MKKEFSISAKLDTSEFDRSISDIAKKLKDVSQPISSMQQNTQNRVQQNGLGGGMSAQSMETFQKATQSARRELDSLISEQAKGQEKLGKFIVQRTESVKKLVQEQKTLVKGSEEELKIREKISKAEMNQQQLKEQYRQRDAALNQALDAKENMKAQGVERLMNAYRGGGTGGALTAAGRMASNGANAIGGSIAGIAGIAGLATKGFQFGNEMYKEYNKIPLNVASSQGSAIQNTLGQKSSDIYSGRTSFENVWSPERQRAQAMAKQNMEAKQASDTNTSTLGLTGFGAVTGALAGGLPTLGAGAIPGAIAGGAAGFGMGAIRFMTNERARTKDLSMLPSFLGGDKYKEKYDSMNSEDFSKDYSKATEDLKNQNPFKKDATTEYEQNFQRNIQAQRSMGLKNENFYGEGGYLDKIHGKGFTSEMGLGMSQAIQGAGGSTSSMSGNSGLGLQMQRGMNLSNSGQVLGTLSGSIGGDKATEQAAIKIMAEGMKLGLDSSKFAEENSRFVQATAEIIARSGAKGESDIERTSKNFGQFVGDNTNKGIEAAQSSYGEYQNRSKTMGGSTGVMQFAGMMKDEKLRNLSTIDKQSFGQMGEDEISESNPLAVGLAKKLGISVEDLAKRKTSLTEGSSSRFREFDKDRDFLKKSGITMEMGLDPAQRDKFSPEVEKSFTNMLSTQQVEKGNTGIQQMISRGSRELGGRKGAFSDNAAENLTNDKLTRDTGQMEDATIKGVVSDSKVVLANFRDMAKTITEAAKESAAMSRQTKEAAADIAAALKSGDSKALQKALESINSSKNQPHGGR